MITWINDKVVYICSDFSVSLSTVYSQGSHFKSFSRSPFEMYLSWEKGVGGYEVKRKTIWRLCLTRDKKEWVISLSKRKERERPFIFSLTIILRELNEFKKREREVEIKNKKDFLLSGRRERGRERLSNSVSHCIIQDSKGMGRNQDNAYNRMKGERSLDAWCTSSFDSLLCLDDVDSCLDDRVRGELMNQTLGLLFIPKQFVTTTECKKLKRSCMISWRDEMKQDKKRKRKRIRGPNPKKNSEGLIFPSFLLLLLLLFVA